MKIRKVVLNNQKRCIEVDTPKGKFGLPFSKLQLVPTVYNRIAKIRIDPELGREGVTYVLESGKEDSVPLDAFLDYNQEPDYMRKTHLYKLTLKALESVKKSRLPKREIARRLRTSPAQLYRLLDTTNYKKTIDQMIRLLVCLGTEVRIQTKAA